MPLRAGSWKPCSTRSHASEGLLLVTAHVLHACHLTLALLQAWLPHQPTALKDSMTEPIGRQMCAPCC